MTLVQGRSRLRKERLSVALFDSFSPPKLGDELSNQPNKSLKVNFPIVIVFATALSAPKYTKKDLQRIFKTVLEAQTSTTSVKS